MKTKKMLIILFGILILIMCINSNSYARVQSNDESPIASKSIPQWMQQIRQMEQLGGGLGLEETINGQLLSNNGVNNLDCHMQKNTEYGGLAILSASSYGNPEKITNGQTTTGNASGVVMNINGEWTSAGTISWNSVYTNAQKRYKNIYNMNYAAKAGDAITETAGWHGSTNNTWLSWKNVWNGANIDQNANCYAGLVRAYSGSIFSYYGYAADITFVGWDDGGWGVSKQHPAYFEQKHPSRAVIVVGKGF